MGCASSTPMIATAGSEMLKAATHVAEDATQTAQDAVQDVTSTLGKTLDTAKENVGTAVTGIAQELGTAFKEKTEALDEAKNNLMGKLHLGIGGGNGGEQPHSKEMKPETEAIANSVSGADTNKTLAAHVRATGMRQQAIDESGDEGDIEETELEEERRSRGPTPTPTHDVDSLKTSTPEPEIEQALANYKEDSPPTPKPTLAELEQLTAEVSKSTADLSDALAAGAVAPVVNSGEQPRPGTTEWEKFADMLALSRRFQHESGLHKRGGKMGGGIARYGLQLLDAPQLQREKPHSPTAAGRRTRDDDSSLSDHYYNGYSSPRSSAKRQKVRLPRALLGQTRRFQREFASLMAAGNPLARQAQSKLPAFGRKFDFNPNRSRVGSPKTSTRGRIGSPLKVRGHARSIISSPISLSRQHFSSPLPTRKELAIGSSMSSPLPTHRSSHTRLGSPAKVATLSRSSRSSSTTNNSIVHRSQRATPISRSPSNVALALEGNTALPYVRHASPALSPIRLDAVVASPCGRRSVSPWAARSPNRIPLITNTSSFLSSPRCSPFSIRKAHSEFGDKENKVAFVADLSSVNEQRTLLSPSPYKVRERCVVCYSKYVIK